jgi:hypothetical protein
LSVVGCRFQEILELNTADTQIKMLAVLTGSSRTNAASFFVRFSLFRANYEL